jgi:hypothetical protein
MKQFFSLAAALLALMTANASLAQDSEAVGHLQPFGGYLTTQHGSTVSLLPDNSILVYGYGTATQEWLSQQDQTDAVRHRSGVADGPDPSPKLYDPAHQGWRRLPNAPECLRGKHYLHTATVLPGGQVLIAGGICEVTKILNDPTPVAPYAGLSLWDGKSHHWQSVPALTQTRIFHTATLMPDGSVLLVGGESDPQLSPDADEPVLSSAERYASGTLSAVPPMNIARAKHSATALSDGSLLVIGGFDSHDQPLASVELLNTQGTAWKTLPSMHVARYSHTATLLADGRVLVTGGMGEDGKPLRSVEIWNPASGEWSESEDLPVGLYGHAALRLPSGDVLVAGGAWLPNFHGHSVPWAWLWNARSGEWQLAGMASPNGESDMSSPISLAFRPDGSVLVFTPTNILRWQAGPLADDAAPAWQRAPALVKLADHRLMAVGYLDENFSNMPVARIWDATTNRWSAAGTLALTQGGNARTLLLPSGDVIYVMVYPFHSMLCQRWKHSDNTWSSCGSASLQYLSKWEPQLGVLPDGRAYAIVNSHEAAVYDGTVQWSIWQVNWQNQGLTYAAPLLAGRAATTITDPANGQSFEVNAAGARFLHISDPMRATSMLWNARKNWWDYVLLGRQMGPSAEHLPDGCALSTDPLALFRPADARVFPLADPGFGSTDHTMVVMDDGTVVVIGPGVGTQEPGAGFFHRKATCAGFAAAPAGDRYISPNAVVDPIPPLPITRNAGTAPVSLWRLGWRAVTDYKWLILACTAPLLAYRLLRRVRWPRMTGARSLSIRLLLYGSLAIVLMPWGLSLWGYVSRIPTAQWHQLGSSARQAAHSALTPARQPCDLIGMWSSTHQGSVHRIELKDDGRYVMQPNHFDNLPPGDVTGDWKVQDNHIVWRDGKSGTVDTNPMENVRDGHFEVIENNGTRTSFDRIEATPSTRCEQH